AGHGDCEDPPPPATDRAPGARRAASTVCGCATRATAGFVSCAYLTAVQAVCASALGLVMIAPPQVAREAEQLAELGGSELAGLREDGGDDRLGALVGAASPQVPAAALRVAVDAELVDDLTDPRRRVLRIVDVDVAADQPIVALHGL